MASELQFGITEKGVLHTDAEPEFDLETKFRMVKESGAYDYLDKTPFADQVDDYLRLSEKFGLPVSAGGWFYTLGRDEALMAENLEIGARLGSRVHNTQILSYHADGRLVTNREVADTYLRAFEIGQRVGCMPTFEVHVNMWSEDFRRVNQVAEMVAEAGVPYRMTLDHSHVIFKIDNPEEQAVFDIRSAVESGELVLDPFAPGNVCEQWIERGYVQHCHARAAVPNNPKNIWGRHPDGSVGRGIQYPFIEPAPGEYHSEWREAALEPWKEVMRRLMTYHATHDSSPLGQISTEFIPPPDYGAGHKYSIFEHSVACARWLRETWRQTAAAEAAE